MIEIRPKVDPISTESLMMYFAECLKKFCIEQSACRDCIFYDKNCGCKLSGVTPAEEWSV